MFKKKVLFRLIREGNMRSGCLIKDKCFDGGYYVEYKGEGTHRTAISQLDFICRI